MKNSLKALSAAAALTCAVSAQAAFVNIGGLNVPTGGHIEVASIYENVVTAVGQELKGFGEVAMINGLAIGTLCAGCELTYRFEQYFVTSIAPNQITFSGGVIKFYLGFGANNDFNPFASASSAVDLAAATNGTLFLTLAGHAVNAAGDTFIGNGVNIGAPNAVGSGSGLVDVVAGGGIATGNFDTNSIAAAFGSSFADFQLGSSFSNVFLPHPSECQGAAVFTGPACLAGSADLRGLVIPEPGSVALVGLALLGLAGTAKRRKN